ncbi:MAG: right-handed parallel beta-helix repeat-containing protein [Thermoproteota archaeon]|nr:right-handed parallel beta-helix repeat-containing protein [Thermoproteota archaeon]
MANVYRKITTAISGCILAFVLIVLMSFGQQEHSRFIAQAGEAVCTEYNQTENKINVSCNSNLQDIAQTINDTRIVQNLGNGEFILNATLEIDDGVTFEINSSSPRDSDVRYLKIAGENGIIADGKILIDGVKITSWNISSNSVILQNVNGIIPRAYIRFAASEGSQILNSEFGYLGYVEPGLRGFDLLGKEDGEPPHDMIIRGNKFHDMLMGFYSNRAYNIVIDGNEYYNNIKYTVDPHSLTHDMNITNNYIHHNRIGIICSLDCYNILIEGNKVYHNTEDGIFFSRNMHDSVARNNHVYNSTTGIMVSESSNNQIYNNTIEGVTANGIHLFNPALPDDGLTENNLVYNNSITNAKNGIVATRSQDNIVQNTTFSDIESSQYLLSGDSSIRISGQHFGSTLISHDDSATRISE